MKTRLVWKDCHFFNYKNAFWIECTDEELISNILPVFNDPELKHHTKVSRGCNPMEEFTSDTAYKNFFIVSFDLSQIRSERWSMPYSGLWNAGNPFSMIDVIDFDNLDDLKDINKRVDELIINFKGLPKNYSGVKYLVNQI
jgi:hypothetical protein